MMMAVGCIQAQRCHTNTCPVGVTTQDPRRARALNVPDKTVRVQRFQQGTVAQAQQLMGSRWGLHGPSEVQPWMLMRRVEQVATSSYADLYEWLESGELLDAPPESWAADWRRADPDSFKARRTREDARHADRR